MKYLTVLFLLLSTTIIAQSPELLNYQAIARDAVGDPLVNQPIGVQFLIHQTTAIGTVVFSESHAPTTDDLGLFSLRIGDGTPSIGSIAGIDWGSGPYFLEVRMDPAGGTSYVPVGTQQLLSVPYALHAKTAETPDTDWTETVNEVYTLKDVGVGLSSPARVLDVGGAGIQYSRVTSTNGATTGFELVRQGAGQDWGWTNSSGFFDLYNVTNDFVSSSTADIIATFTSTGRLGIGDISPATELEVNGTIRASTLAGIGDRPLVANSSGDIVVSSASTTQYWAVNGFSFNSSSSSFTFGSIAFNTSGTTSLWAPVNLPHGATVTSFYINYGDISATADLNVRLLRINTPGQFVQSTMSDITSSGTPGASSPEITDFTIIDPVIDNLTSTYVIEVRPEPGTSWDLNRINIRNARISYTEP